MSKIKSIVVAGPGADVAQLGNYSGTPSKAVSPLEGIENKVSGTGIIVTYASSLAEAVESAREADVAIVCTKISEGEGGDRLDLINKVSTAMDLPSAQEDLINAVAGTGTPTIVVLFGTVVTMEDWIDNAQAILEAWYPGEEGGTAIADVLFGDYNPSGKLPITFYKSVDQLPPFDDYDITKGRTYMYMAGAPQFPFGYGLSYTEFEYSDIGVTPSLVGEGENVRVTFNVKNVGDREGDAVPQLYIRDLEASVPVPAKRLVGFARVTLEPSEKKTVELYLTPDQLSLYDENLSPVVEPGTFEVMVGESSQDIVLRDNFEVTELIRAKFEYEDLEVLENEVDPGDPVEVVVTVKGIGGLKEGRVEVNADNEVVGSNLVYLNFGGRRRITLTVRLWKSGTYEVAVGNLPPKTVTVRAKPAEFECKGLQVTVDPDGYATVEATIWNIGSYEGAENVEAELDGEVVDSQGLTLGPGEERALTFRIPIYEEGTHEVRVGGLTESFNAYHTAEREGEGVPLLPVIGGVVAAVAVIGLWLWRRR